MAEHKVEGGNMLLFIDPNGGTTYDIVVCLTSVSKSDSITVVDASSACGPDKSPGTLELSYAFEGQHLQDPTTGSISGTDLRFLLRSEQTIGWKIAPETPIDGDEIEEGTGFIAELSSTYSFDSVGTFTGTIQPYGNPSLSIYGTGPTPSVNIGGYNWMTKNLSVTKYANGDDIDYVPDDTAWAAATTGAWRFYNNDPATEPVYGRMYNWYAVTDIRGLKPDNDFGWIVPSAAAFAYLSSVVSDDGNALKEVGTTHWDSPGGTNTSGFTALGAGQIADTGVSLDQTLVTNYWTTDALDGFGQGKTMYLVHYDNSITEYPLLPNYGLSIRCFWD